MFFFIFKERMMDVLINETRALSVGLHMEHISGSEKKTEWPKRHKNPESTCASVAFVSITIFG